MHSPPRTEQGWRDSLIEAGAPGAKREPDRAKPQLVVSLGKRSSDLTPPRLTPNLQLALRFDSIFLCQGGLDRGDQLAPNLVVLRVTMISKEEVIADRPTIVRMHQLGQRSCPAGLFPFGD